MQSLLGVQQRQSTPARPADRAPSCIPYPRVCDDSDQALRYRDKASARRYAGTTRNRNSGRISRSGVAAVALLASLLPLGAAQSCIPLKGSKQCPAFNGSSISTTQKLTSFFPFLSGVTDASSFDQAIGLYLNGSYVQDKYANFIGCHDVQTNNGSAYYARYAVSVLCNAIVQNSIGPCGLTGAATTPLCADSCAQNAISEEEIASTPSLCEDPGTNYIAQIRADFIDCSLPADSLSGTCVTGAENEPDNCGFASNLGGLCGFCASSSPNATDSCCGNSNVGKRCQGITPIPSATSMPTLFPTTSSTSSSASSTATNGTAARTGAADDTASHGLSGGAIAGIVIGSIVAALLLALLIVLLFLCLRRRQNSKNGSLNQPSPRRAGTGIGAAGGLVAGEKTHGGREILPAPGGRVARMAALEGESSDEKNAAAVEAALACRRGNPVLTSEAGRSFPPTSGEDDSDGYGYDAYGKSPASRGSPTRRPVTSRRGSLSSASALGGARRTGAVAGAGAAAAAGLHEVHGLGGGRHSPSTSEPEDTTSPSTNNALSSPEGDGTVTASGQSEQLPIFKDYYSNDDINPGDRVTVLWAYAPRAPDEFELERGEVLKIVGIWDDGWATGVRVPGERAEDFEEGGRVMRDSGVSGGRRDVGGLGSGAMGMSPNGEVKAFPLVCVCLPDHWRKTIEGDSSTGTGTNTGTDNASPAAARTSGNEGHPGFANF